MTPTEALAKWKPVLRLADWCIRASTLEPERDSRSNVNIDCKVKQAVIRLRSDTPPSQVERQVVHELLHVLLSGMEDTYDQAKTYTPKAWDEAGDVLWSRSEESAIEALVDALTGTERANWESAPVWNEAFPA